MGNHKGFHKTGKNSGKKNPGSSELVVKGKQLSHTDLRELKKQVGEIDVSANAEKVVKKINCGRLIASVYTNERVKVTSSSSKASQVFDIIDLHKIGRGEYSQPSW